MNEQELRTYLAEHLKIEFFCTPEEALAVRLLLDDETISDAVSFVNYFGAYSKL